MRDLEIERDHWKREFRLCNQTNPSFQAEARIQKLEAKVKWLRRYNDSLVEAVFKLGADLPLPKVLAILQECGESFKKSGDHPGDLPVTE